MNYTYVSAVTGVVLVFVVIYKLEDLLGKSVQYSKPDDTYSVEPNYDAPVRPVVDQQGNTPTILRLGKKIENGPINYCSYRCNIMQMETAPEFIIQNADAVVLDKNRINDKIAGLKDDTLQVEDKGNNIIYFFKFTHLTTV